MSILQISKLWNTAGYDTSKARFIFGAFYANYANIRTASFNVPTLDRISFSFPKFVDSSDQGTRIRFMNFA